MGLIKFPCKVKRLFSTFLGSSNLDEAINNPVSLGASLFPGTWFGHSLEVVCEDETGKG